MVVFCEKERANAETPRNSSFLPARPKGLTKTTSSQSFGLKYHVTDGARISISSPARSRCRYRDTSPSGYRFTTRSSVADPSGLKHVELRGWLQRDEEFRRTEFPELRERKRRAKVHGVRSLDLQGRLLDEQTQDRSRAVVLVVVAAAQVREDSRQGGLGDREPKQRSVLRQGCDRFDPDSGPPIDRQCLGGPCERVAVRVGEGDSCDQQGRGGGGGRDGPLSSRWFWTRSWTRVNLRVCPRPRSPCGGDSAIARVHRIRSADETSSHSKRRRSRARCARHLE